VVSERGSHFGDTSQIGALVKRNLHRLADHIVVNSVSHQSWLRRNFPWMTGRLTTIYNGFELGHFSAQLNPPRERRELRLMAVGRIDPGKNVITLLEALRLFHATYGWVPLFDWVGRRDDLTASGREYCRQVDDVLNSLPEVKRCWRWLGERSDVPDLLSDHHALVHPTFHEGLPNAVCEALAAGRPVLASDVCDNGLLVTDGERGFLFNPSSPESIAASIGRLVALTDEEWIRMSKSARAYAEEALSVNRFVAEYENLFSELTASHLPNR
jgi:glycosyltransferase involved in cell wall biosynthesis